MGATLTCRCGFDSGFLNPPGGHNVAETTAASGMHFVRLQNGSTWICPTCYQRTIWLFQQVSEIFGSTRWSVSALGRPRVPDKR